MQEHTAAPTEVTLALGDYHVGERLGSGQFGVVWAARHRQLDRDVAVKLLAEAMHADPQNSQRFRREARILAHLDHRHVVKVYDYRETQTLYLLIMERLTGGTFAERIAAGLRTESIVVAILAAASALHHVHREGVLHRDVKPQNLMFDGHGVLKVTDFGTARDQGVVATGPTAGPLLELTAVDVSYAGQFIGTPGYAAPEQAASALGVPGGPIGPAADQYALAAVLYQALSGSYTHPINGGPGVLLARRVSSDARDLQLANPAVPALISAVVMRALQRDPTQRFESVEALAVALAQACTAEWGPNWATGSEVQLAEPGPIWDALHSSRSQVPSGSDGVAAAPRSRRRVILLGAAALVALAGAGVATTLALGSSDDSGSDDSGSNGSGSDENQGAPDETSGSFAATNNSASAADQITLQTRWTFPTGDKIFASALVLPDLVVVGSFDGTIYALNKSDGTVRWQEVTERYIRSSAAAAGGLVVVGGDDGVLRALWSATGVEEWRASFGFGIVSSPLVIQGLVVVGADGLYSYNAVDGADGWTFSTPEFVISSPAAAGDLVLVGCNDGFLYAVRLVDGNQQWKLDTGGAVVAAPVVQGDVAFIGSRSGDFLAVNVTDGKPIWTVPLGSEINATALVVENQIYVGTAGGEVRCLDATDGSVTWTWRANGPVDAAPIRWRDWLIVGSHDANLYVLDPATGDELGRFATSGPILSPPRVDDDAIYVGSYDGSLYCLEQQG